MAGELQDQLEKFTNQARFVKMIVDKQLSVSNRKKADIVAELRKKEFRPFPKVLKAKDSGETEDVVEEEEEDQGSDSDYDYLLGMAIWSLTKEKVRVSFWFLISTGAHASSRSRNFANKLQRRRRSFLHCSSAPRTRCGMKILTISSHNGRYVSVNNYSVGLLRTHTAMLQVSSKLWDSKRYTDSTGKKVKRRQATLVTRKSLPGPGKRKGDDDDSEDEFKPTKALAKAKKLAEPKPARAKPATAVPSKSTVDIDDGDDDVPLPPPRKRAPVKKTKDESESDFEVVEKPALKKVAKAKGIKADSDSEVEVIPGPTVKGKGKDKEVLKRKR